MRKLTLHLPERLSGCGGGPCVYKIANSLDLSEIHTAVGQGTEAELTRVGQTCARGEAFVDDTTKDDGRTVAAYLDNIFAGERVGCLEISEDGLVNGVAGGVFERFEYGGTRLGRVIIATDQCSDLQRRGAAQTNHSDTAAAEWGRKCDDGVRH